MKPHDSTSSAEPPTPVVSSLACAKISLLTTRVRDSGAREMSQTEVILEHRPGGDRLLFCFQRLQR